MIKKRIIVLFFAICSVVGSLCDNGKKSVVALTHKENSTLDMLYEYDLNGSLFQTLDTLTNVQIDYYLEVLCKHIQILEYKLATRKFVWLLSEPMFMGVWIGFGVCQMLYKQYPTYQHLITGKFKNHPWITKDMLCNLKSIRFTRSEKRKLDLISVENMYYSAAEYIDRKDYTIAELEKIKYLVRRLALQSARENIFMCGSFTIVFTLMACACFYAAYIIHENENEPLKEGLERDRRIFELLKDAKASNY